MTLARHLADDSLFAGGGTTGGAAVCGIDSWALDTEETRQLREQVIAALVEAGDIVDERWRRAFVAVPRPL